MKPYNRILGMLAFPFLLLIGCNAPTLLPDAVNVRGSSSQGILLISSACDECPFPAFYVSRNPNGKGDFYQIFGGGSTIFDNRIEVEQPYSSLHAKDSYPADYKGRVIITMLPPGDYYIFKCSTWYRWGNTEFIADLNKPIKFTIKPGVINYGGQITLIFNKSKIEEGYSIKIDDHQERDISLALKYSKVLHDTPVEKHILQR